MSLDPRCYDAPGRQTLRAAAAITLSQHAALQPGQPGGGMRPHAPCGAISLLGGVLTTSFPIPEQKQNITKIANTVHGTKYLWETVILEKILD